MKTYEEQLPGVDKLFIEDWKRTGYNYKTVFEGESHHMVKDKNMPGFRIETNYREILQPKLHLDNTTDFHNKVARKDKDYTNTLNDSRFEMINKSPDCMTTVPRVPGFDFTEHTARAKKLFGNTETGAFYDAKIGITKPRLDAGIPKMK